MDSDDSEEGVMSVKLWINRETKKVLLAEGNKSFVFYLFHLLNSPLGISGPLVVDNGKNCCMQKLRQSLQSAGAPFKRTFLPRDFGLTSSDDDDMGSRSWSSSPVAGVDVSDGFPVETAPERYTLTDDLKLEPCASEIEASTLVERFGLPDASVLEERMVGFGYREYIYLLGESLMNPDVLTRIFLPDIQPEPESTETPEAEPRSDGKSPAETEDAPEPSQKKKVQSETKSGRKRSRKK